METGCQLWKLCVYSLLESFKRMEGSLLAMSLEERVVLSTPKGTFRADRKATVIVESGTPEESRPLEKLAEDVMRSDLIGVHAEGIDLTLDEIKRDYASDPVYMRSKREVVTETREGREIPVFRQWLIRALAPRARVIVDERKTLMLDGQDYTKEEYAAMLSVLRTIVNANVPSEGIIADSTMREWLHAGYGTGASYAPRDWDVFRRLSAIDIPEDPVFSRAFESKEHANGFYFSHGDYVNAHQVARRARGFLNREDPWPEHTSNGNLRMFGQRDRLRMLYERHGMRVRDHVVFVPVESVRIECPSGRGPPSRPEPVFRRGLIPELEGSSSDYRAIMEEWHALSNMISDGLHQFLYKGDYISGEPRIKRFSVLATAEEIIVTLLKTDPTIEATKRLYHDKLGEPLDKSEVIVGDAVAAFTMFYNAGTLDSQMGVPNGTWLQAVSTMRRRAAILPRCHYNLLANTNILNMVCRALESASLDRAQRRTYERAKQNLEAERPALEGRVARYHLQETYERSPSAMMRMLVNRGLMEPSADNSFDRAEVRDKMREGTKYHFLRQERALALLERAGTPLAIRLSHPTNRYVPVTNSGLSRYL